MYENNLKVKTGLTNAVNKFLQNGGAVEQAIDAFAASSAIELPKNGEIIIRS